MRLGNRNSARLTEPDVHSIRLAYVPGEVRMSDLAERHGVSRATIRNIVTGSSWGDVATPGWEPSSGDLRAVRWTDDSPFARHQPRGLDALIVAINHSTRLEGDCIVWTRSRDKDGYGRLYSRALGERRAHRIAYILAKGAIPAGLLIRHHCDNPPCVNPDHLDVGTAADNAHDAVARGRFSRSRRTS